MSGAKSDAADAHVLADMVRTDSHQLRPVAGDTAQAAAVKVVTRTHKTLIWERTRCTQRLRHALRDYFPAALEAFEDLDAADTLELLARAPEPVSAAKLTTAQISAALKRARRRGIAAKAERIQAVLRAAHLGQPDVVAAAYAASVRALIAAPGMSVLSATQQQPWPQHHRHNPGNAVAPKTSSEPLTNIRASIRALRTVMAVQQGVTHRVGCG